MNHATIDAPAAALRLTIFIGDSDRWHHRPLSSEIVHRAHVAGLAGASVFRGVEGFGASSVVHTSRLLSMSDDMPMAVIIVDARRQGPRLPAAAGRADHRGPGDPGRGHGAAVRRPGAVMTVAAGVRARRGRRCGRGAAAVPDRPDRAAPARLAVPLGNVHGQRRRIADARPARRCCAGRCVVVRRAGLLLGVGFCGALTTYSTLSYETASLIEQRALLYAAANVLGTVLAGLVAVTAGYLVTAALTS